MQRKRVSRLQTDQISLNKDNMWEILEDPQKYADQTGRQIIATGYSIYEPKYSLSKQSIVIFAPLHKDDYGLWILKGKGARKRRFSLDDFLLFNLVE